jgi:GNAT superfamily N-acetyltransferase
VRVKIIELSPDDEVGCIDAVAVQQAAARRDCPEAVLPTPRGLADMLRYGWDLEPEQCYLARDDDGTPLGTLLVSQPTWDNTDNLWLNLALHPDHRDGTLGGTLIEFGEQLARDAGRHIIGLGSYDVADSRALAEKHGYELKAVEVNRRQDLAGLDWSIAQSLYDEALAAASGYELTVLTGALPEELLEPMVAVTASINDAPKDDLDIEDDVISPERLRAYEQAQDKSDHTLHRVIAREKATGELAGHTVVAVERERPHIGEQHDTAVSRDHRGHRLGALLKSAMLLWMRDEEPALGLIDTWNAESNDHMIHINEQLNYRIIARVLDYQKTL